MTFATLSGSFMQYLAVSVSRLDYYISAIKPGYDVENEAWIQ